MKKILTLMTFLCAAFILKAHNNDNILPTPILGIYPNTTLVAGTNTKVTPSFPILGAISAVAYTNTNFTGILTVDYTTGVLTVTDAKQAGTYTVTVKAFGFTPFVGETSAMTTFTLTITNPMCSQGSFISTSGVPVGLGPYSVSVGDFNNDGKQDLATANYSSNTVSIRLGDGNGGFSGNTNVGVGNNPNCVTIGDFNGDGKQDFATANRYSASISIRLGDGNGGFSGNMSVPVGSQPYFVAVGDFNEDGKQDLAVSNLNSNSVSIRFGDGNGGFSGNTNLSGLFSPTFIVVGDFNEDGNQDLAILTGAIVSIKFGDGNGGFSGNSNVFIGGSNWTLVMADLNGDGKQDLVSSTSFSGTLAVRLGNGDGTFNITPYIYAGNIQILSIGVGDFNGDGKQDIAFRNIISSASNITILLGNGTGGFSGSIIVPAANDIYGLSVGDFNSDGKQDIATGRNTSTVSIFLGGANEINVKGNNQNIADGSTALSNFNHTFFGSITTGGSFTRTYTIENTGTTNLSISSINITGVNASEFSVSALTPASPIPPNGTATFTATFNPTSIGFKTAVVHINNDDCDEADYDFVVAGISLSACNAPQFTICPTAQSITAANGACSAPVTYTPSVSGSPAPILSYAFSGATVASGNGTGSGSQFNIGVTTVAITANNGCSPNAVCTFTVTVRAPEINVQGNNINIPDGSPIPAVSNLTSFGVVNVGTTTVNTLTIQNTGTTNLNIGNIAITGAGAGSFSVGALTPASPIAAGGSATFTITFAPTTLGSKIATINIANDDCDESDYDFVIRGTSVCPLPVFSTCPSAQTVNAAAGACNAAVSYTPSVSSASTFTLNYIFTGATVGTGSGTGSGLLFNIGVTTVVISATNSCGTATCTFTVTVKAPEINVQGNSLSIVDGDATPSTSDHTDFGSMGIGGNVVRNFVIQNTGTNPLNVGAITMTGTNAAIFAVGPLSPASPILPNGSATFTVTFFSTSAGLKTATVHIANDDCNEADYDFAVQATGTCNIPILSSNSSVCVGATTPMIPSILGGTFSSTNTLVATVNSTTGVVTGVSAGPAIINYVISGCPFIATKLIIVDPSPTVAPLTGQNTVCQGSTTLFSSTTTGGTFTSLNPGTATVNSTSGLVTGVSVGVATITYKILGTNGCSATVSKTILVNDLPFVAPLTGINTICVGATTTFSSATTGGFFTSSNTLVATVSSTTGLVTGVSAGSANIIYTYTIAFTGCSKSVSRSITVTLPTVAPLTGINTISIGGTTTFSSTTTGGVFTSSNTGIATVNANSGFITGISAGTATITYTYTDANGCSNSVTRIVTVLCPIPLLTGSPIVCAGFTTTFSSSVGGGIFTSLNTAVATVNSSTGVVTGVSAGTATITYSIFGCVFIATKNIFVNAAPPIVGLTGPNALCVNGVSSFTTPTTGGTFTSSNPGTATVHSINGIVTGISAGVAIITYTVVGSNGCSNSVTKPILINPLPQIVPLTGVNTVCVGFSTTFSSATTGGNYTSANTTIATVNANTGVITGQSPGTTNIIYTFTVVSTSCSNSVSKSVTVNALPTVAPLTGINTILMGSITTFSSTTTGGVFTSSNTGVATVNATSGLITGVSAGTATITYKFTDANGCSNSVTRVITVNSLLMLGSYPNTTLIEGGNVRITPSAPPTNITSLVAYTSTDFTGTLFVNPTTGMLTVTDAKQEGIFTVTVKGFGNGTSVTTTFTLVVKAPACSQFSFKVGTPVAVGNYPYSIAIADFNNDGKQDIATANSITNSSVSIRLGDGSGSFTGTTNFAVGNSPYSIAVGDFNGDGNQDITTANYDSYTVSIRLGNGAGGLTGSLDLPAGNGTYAVAVGDFNGDGKQDIAAANNTAGTVSVFIGDGNGGFTALSAVISVGNAPTYIAIGDFNNDGKQDLAVPNLSSSTVSILLGNGSGGFSASPNVPIAGVPVGSFPFSVAIGDFNGDGIQDIAVVSIGNMTVSIRLGDGLGGFTGNLEVPTVSNPYTVVIADFNGDFKQDIAFSNSDDQSVSIRLGDGQGGFSGLTNVPFGNNPIAFAVGDLNNDGKLDLVAANYNAGTVSTRMGEVNEIDVQGNSVVIVDGDASPDLLDHTDFGDVFTGDNLTRLYTIKNIGNVPLTVGNPTLSGPDAALFIISTLTPAFPISPGNTATFTVNFAPIAWVRSKATVTLKNDDCDEAIYDFAIHGAGVAPPAAGDITPFESDYLDKKGKNPIFDLHQNRPNPFSNETTISFILPETNNAELSIFDITGRKVYTLNRSFSKGYNEVILTNTELKNSGVYFYRLQSDKYMTVKRMQYFVD